MKSDASLFLDLCSVIINDAAAKCSTVTVRDCARDVQKCTSRFEHEGMSFLTITLPSFGTAFEKCLAKEKVDSTDFTGWSKKGCLPKFLWGFTSLVFEQSGKLKETTNEVISAVESVRQIAYAFKKILLPCTPSREARALNQYVQLEQDLSRFSMPPDSDSTFGAVADLLWGSVFGGEVDYHELYPKHGPGATREGISGNRKYLHKSWHDRLQPFFPFDETAYSNTLAGSFKLNGKRVKMLQEDKELPVKVILVPKTLKAPRIIAKEPVCMQYTQQALASFLVEKLASHWITSGHINFTDQSINQKLAMVASMTGMLATLDLSSASDRVPLTGVERMLRINPDLLDGLLATRSTRAVLPDGTIIPLKKFASMGSATCFPVEAMYFFTVILASMWKSSGLPLTLGNLKLLSQDVYIYGDDIIIPVDAVDVVVSALADYNCKVGADKSFWTGKFRESCGADAYDGEWVTPIYIRRIAPGSKRNSSEIISWVSTSDQFHLKGYWKTAQFIKDIVERITGKLPLVLENSPGLGFRSHFQEAFSAHRWNKALHRYEVRTLVASPIYERDVIEGYEALMKCLLSAERRKADRLGPFLLKGPSDQTFVRREAEILAQDDQHLHRSARHGAVSIKSRWTTPY